LQGSKESFSFFRKKTWPQFIAKKVCMAKLLMILYDHLESLIGKTSDE